MLRRATDCEANALPTLLNARLGRSRSWYEQTPALAGRASWGGSGGVSYGTGTHLPRLTRTPPGEPPLRGVSRLPSLAVYVVVQGDVDGDHDGRLARHLEPY